MTDRIDCPECQGSGEQAIGPLRLSCRFCHGNGYVGGDNEPAAVSDASPTHRPVWEEPAVRALAFCHVCFGAGKVVNLGGTGEPTGVVIELPCPACSGNSSRGNVA